jgi:hypothetical protein
MMDWAVIIWWLSLSPLVMSLPVMNVVRDDDVACDTIYSWHEQAIPLSNDFEHWVTNCADAGARLEQWASRTTSVASIYGYEVNIGSIHLSNAWSFPIADCRWAPLPCAVKGDDLVQSDPERRPDLMQTDSRVGVKLRDRRCLDTK